ncbi:hypothetical protein [Vibrio diabolicus]|uniref:hypothetical protein n=1 Tax=Vibrio diabolicus TaxID=50719 RepID=UPI0015F76A01|nr:hypothetical protein [Vibrio diabolicus]
MDNPQTIWMLGFISALLMACEYWLKREFQDAVESVISSYFNGVKARITVSLKEYGNLLYKDAFLIVVSIVLIMVQIFFGSSIYAWLASNTPPLVYSIVIMAVFGVSITLLSICNNKEKRCQISVESV